MNFTGKKWSHLNPIMLCSLIGFLTNTPWVLADQTNNVEFKVKAGYLYNFTKFVTWPEDNSSTFNICIVGANPFGDLLDPIEQKTAFGLPIKLYKLTTLKPEQRCRIIYLAASIENSGAADNAYISRTVMGSLTVGEDQSFIDNGGMIRFVTVNAKIKLQINLQKLKQNGLKISSKLLEVADLVEDEHD